MKTEILFTHKMTVMMMAVMIWDKCKSVSWILVGNAMWCKGEAGQNHYNGVCSTHSQDTEAKKYQGILSNRVRIGDSERYKQNHRVLVSGGQLEFSVIKEFFFSRVESCSLQLSPQTILWTFFFFHYLS